jgi:hypothetical protein
MSKKTKIMKWQSFFLAVFLLAFINTALTQETRFYVPKEIKQAYENGTRSWDGTPGPKYWQNTADYQIEVSVNPTDRSIKGSEEVTYYNNSPEKLTTLVIRLYNEVFKKGNARDSRLREEDIHEGTELSNLMVNGEEYTVGTRESRVSGTNLYVSLREPLEPGASLTFSVDWEQKVPLSNRRTGARDSTTFFIAYWYPQVAVYDDVFGWDNFSYTIRTEFYNNLANFDVNITVPEDFTVWATGVLQNPEEVLNDDIRERYEQAHRSAETIHILTQEDLAGEFRHDGSTWHYGAERVSDFSFGMSDHYAWDAAIQQVEDRQVFISTAFPAEEAEDYAKVTAIQQKTMKHFSEDIPGVPYPYPEFCTFIGLFGGGMETPMMANNDSPRRGVTIHEMFHTYFPMYVRVNEKRFAWMDEGWATFNTQVVTDRFFEKNDNPPYAGSAAQMQSTVGTISDLPLIVSSQFMDGTNYGYASYPLPGFIYGVLHDHLGDELFLKAYREYINRWAYKSPTPYDFFYTFEDVTGQDLGWLWEPWFFEFGTPELEIKEFKGKKLVVENKGTRPIPVELEVIRNDGSSKKIYRSAGVWRDAREITVRIDDPKEVKRMMLNMNVPDLEIADNLYPSLKDLYSGKNLAPDLAGAYRINEIPFSVYVREKMGGLQLEIPGQYEAYLLPKTGTEFESLDGMVQVQFQVEDNKVEGLNLKAFGYDLTSTKE